MMYSPSAASNRSLVSFAGRVVSSATGTFTYGRGHSAYSQSLRMCSSTGTAQQGTLSGSKFHGSRYSTAADSAAESSGVRHYVERNRGSGRGRNQSGSRRRRVRSDEEERVPSRHRDTRRQESRGTRVENRIRDRTSEETAMDVEKHFPQAISFLKATSTSETVSEQRRQAEWSSEVRSLNADGVPIVRPEPELSTTRPGARGSFFDEGSVDIRSDRAPTSDFVNDPVAHQEAMSPDILKLTGGQRQRHGVAAVDPLSNEAPADLTMEADSGNPRAWGDTPEHLTDMLRERLMELKAERLSEDRNDTFLPRRLSLASDEMVALGAEMHNPDSTYGSRMRAQQQQSQSTRKKSPAMTATLADEVEDAPPFGEHENVSETRRRAAEELLRRATDLVPGGSEYSPLNPSNSFTAQSVAQRTEKSIFDSNEYDTGSDDAVSADGSVYLFRTLQRAGLSSRREAIAVISSGQVRVDGKPERNPFRMVRAENDILVNGHAERLRFTPPRLWLYHKPASVIVSRNDVGGRTLITKHARILGFDHLIPVGSLPMRAHGAILLTNDGELSRFLENPKTMIQQTYLLRVRPAIDPVLAHKLNTKGIFINGTSYRNAEFLVNPAAKSRFSIKVKVRGESMPISHLMQHLGRTVERGGRISVGPFALGSLAVGSIREVTVPPYYMKYTGADWKPFIERDWPFFRRQRAMRLKRLSQYRELTPKEVEELDNFTYDELKDALSFESSELEAEADKVAAAMETRPSLGETALLTAPWGELAGDDNAQHDSSEFDWRSDARNDVVVEDITALTD